LKRVLIIGGGLAGLSAAVNAADAGLDVTVLEAAAVPGGRVRRVSPGDGFGAIDYGQHLMMGCYKESLAFASRIGTRRDISEIKGVTPFVSRPGTFHPYRIGSLPAPLHALPGLMSLTQLNLRERMSLGIPVAAAKASRLLSRENLDLQTAGLWLRRNGQSENVVKNFWEPLVLATMNMAINEASALPLVTVLHRIFSTRRRDAVPMASEKTLHEVFIEPAIKALEKKGGRIFFSEKVARLVHENGTINAALTKEGELFPADYFILAVPSWDVEPLLNNLPKLSGLREAAGELGSSPIVNVDLWFDRECFQYPYAGFLGSSLQWVFNHPSRNGSRPRLSIVVSGAERLESLPSEEILRECKDELARFFPETVKAKLLKTLVIKARKATIRLKPGTANLRPTSKSACKNLFFAGDWTDTGLPATIEGAVLSGRLASGGILK